MLLSRAWRSERMRDLSVERGEMGVAAARAAVPKRKRDLRETIFGGFVSEGKEVKYLLDGILVDASGYLFCEQQLRRKT
jgi:hypothetical protein